MDITGERRVVAIVNGRYCEELLAERQGVEDSRGRNRCYASLGYPKYLAT